MLQCWLLELAVIGKWKEKKSFFFFCEGREDTPNQLTLKPAKNTIELT